MQDKLMKSFAVVASLAATLSSGMAYALPDFDRKSPGYDHFEETVGTFIQADACLADGSHNASIAIPFLYSVTDFSRFYPEDYKSLSALMTAKHVELKNNQESPQTPPRLMAGMRSRHEAQLKSALEKNSDEFWRIMEQEALTPAPPSMPFTTSFKNVLEQKGAEYIQTLTVQNNVLPILQQMDDTWRKQRRQVFNRGDESILKNVAAAFAPVLKDTIERFYSGTEASTIVDESFGNVVSSPSDFTQGIDVFYTSLSGKFGVKDETALTLARNMDVEWLHELRANTPMEQAELNNYFNELWTEATNAFIRERVPDEKVVQVMTVLWAQQAAKLSPADMNVAKIQDSPKLLAAIKEIVQALQVTVEGRTGISIKAQPNIVHVPAKPGCLTPQ